MLLVGHHYRLTNSNTSENVKGEKMRLIDADALKKHYAWWEDDKQKLFDSIVDSQPTVDAVPVVRCKDCKHWACDDCETYCDELGIFNTDMNSYCSYAKRKEE